MGDFNVPLLQIDRLSTQKLNREMVDQTDIINPMDLTDIFRYIQPSTKEYVFFSGPHVMRLHKIAYVFEQITYEKIEI